MNPVPILLSMSLLAVLQNPGEWRKVTSDAGGFSVTVPGEVGQQNSTRPSDQGPIELNQLIAESDGIRFIATSMLLPTDLPPDQYQLYFDGVRGSYAIGAGRTLQKEQRGTFQGMPICYFRVASLNDQGRAVVTQSRFLIGDSTHTYILQVVVPKGVEVNESVKRFFDSFKRTDRKPKVASKAGPKTPAEEKARGPGPAVAAAAAKWRPVSPTGKGFTISLPGEPKHEKHDAPGGSMKIDSYEVDLGDLVYTVAVYEFPKSVPSEASGTTAEGLCKDFAAGLKGTIAELKPVQGGGLEGREALFDLARPDNGQPAVGRVRSFVVGARAYMVAYGGEPGTADRPEVEKYLDSFKVTKSPASSKAKAKALP